MWWALPLLNRCLLTAGQNDEVSDDRIQVQIDSTQAVKWVSSHDVELLPDGTVPATMSRGWRLGANALCGDRSLRIE